MTAPNLLATTAISLLLDREVIPIVQGMSFSASSDTEALMIQFYDRNRAPIGEPAPSPAQAPQESYYAGVAVKYEGRPISIRNRRIELL